MWCACFVNCEGWAVAVDSGSMGGGAWRVIGGWGMGALGCSENTGGLGNSIFAINGLGIEVSAGSGFVLAVKWVIGG